MGHGTSKAYLIKKAIKALAEDDAAEALVHIDFALNLIAVELANYGEEVKPNSSHTDPLSMNQTELQIAELNSVAACLASARDTLRLNGNSELANMGLSFALCHLQMGMDKGSGGESVEEQRFNVDSNR